MDFIEWLQSRLIAQSFSVGRSGADGVIGGDTTSALLSFQRAKGLTETGVADAATVRALRDPPIGGSIIKHPDDAPPPAETMPPWMAEMARRYGLNERTDNKALSDWLKIGKWLGNPAKMPWCGDAIETCIVKTLPHEPVPNNPFFAQNWKSFGIDPGRPIVGAIGVIRWSATAGHVGIVASYDDRRRKVALLGGNQSNSIRLSTFDLNDFIAFRWPRGFPIKSYPDFTGTAASGGAAATR